MNSAIRRTACEVAILLMGILLTTEASARVVTVTCDVSQASFTCRPDDGSFTTFTARMLQPMGSGIDIQGTIDFKDGVANYKNKSCDLNLGVDHEVSGSIFCNGHEATLKMSLDWKIPGRDLGSGLFK